MMRPHSRLASLFTALALWLSLIPLGSLFGSTFFMFEVAPLVASTAVVGVGLTLLRAPRILILCAQTIALLAVLAWRGLALAEPGGGALASLRLLTSDGVDAIRTQSLPLTPDPGLTWLILLLAALLLLVVELLVVGLEQPSWALAPLSLPFALPALLINSDLGFLDVLPAAGSFLLILLTCSAGYSATGKASRRGRFGASRAGTGLALAVAASIVALMLAPLIPLGEKQPWNDGSNGPIQLGDPTVRLNDDLLRPADTPVLTYRPSHDEPTYLRTVALSNLTQDGARLMPMRLSRFGLSGAYDYPGTRVNLDVQMFEVESEYLAAPFAPNDFSAEGLWSFDPETLTIVAAGEKRSSQTLNLAYTVESVLPDPTREAIEAAGAGTGVDPVNSEIPAGLSPEVQTLTEQVTGGLDTAGSKALAITAFLRSDAFDYSLNAPRTSGSSGSINSFLLDDPSGYCIHFAAAMITMARLSDIPARMAVGFTPGERQPDGSYLVTSHDSHAWPELYLDGLGWVPFEPTPAYSGPPDYTDPAAVPSAPASAPPSASATPSSQPQAPEPSPSAQPNPTPPAAQGGGGAGLAVAVAVVLLVAALVPVAVRTLQRWLRLRPGRSSAETVDGAWAEARASFIDHALAWAPGSPVPAAEAMAATLAPEGAATLAAIAATVERSRYGRVEVSTQELPAQVAALRHALARQASIGRRFRARLLPRSVFRPLV